ncbi:hypothetical protein B9479_003597 [Cryptococcus floricola]|uniref:Uncharacterized protein n=1 Tax=Cryptococcus floricola TaxID=2591691 RepID=A0A5D3B028_9TREE|nr:hypothetical protein B9479_003597 [Cryptococcus floricola]
MSAQPQPQLPLTSSQLPTSPAQQPQPVPKTAAKQKKQLRGPAGNIELFEWQATMHTCQAINVDGERCGNSITNPRQNRFCPNGWHYENARYDNVVEMVERRKAADEANAIRRKAEIAEQLALFEAQFTLTSNVDKASSSGSLQSPQVVTSALPQQRQSGFSTTFRRGGLW